jgi:hypothetical protein
MTNSKRLAGLIGPALIVLSISEVLNSDIWLKVPATQTYLAGALWFIAGLSIIRTHNIWTAGWPVLITIVGWFAFIGGLIRMFLPKTAQESGQNTALVLAVQIALLVIGIILTLASYFRKS